MQLDLGLWGLALLVVISVGFGITAALVVRTGTSWLWLIGAAGWFIGGLIASEVVWGRATSAELQPIIDGLAFDESLLGGLIGGVAAVIATRLLTGSGTTQHPTAF